jgi:hypothetical protein
VCPSSEMMEWERRNGRLWVYGEGGVVWCLVKLCYTTLRPNGYLISVNRSSRLSGLCIIVYN